MAMRVIRLFVVFVLFFAPLVIRAQRVSDVKVDVAFDRSTLKDVLTYLEKVTPFTFLASAEVVDGIKGITLQANQQPLDVVLEKILSPHKLQFSQSRNNIILKRKTTINPSKNDSTARTNYTLHGTVISKRKGESVIGATINIQELRKSVISNDYGFFSITLREGLYQVEVSAVGMQLAQFTVQLNRHIQQVFKLDDDTTTLAAVTVTASSSLRDISNPQMGMERLNVAEIKNIPVIFGERDILKTIQLLPGIKQAGEGNSGFYVRGGGIDQNLILLDEAPVYNASHLLGFFSTFNADAIKNVTVYKGTMPPQYGGRLSSAVDIKMNDGNNQEYDISGGIGLIASRLNIEGPLQRGKSSFLISGRRTYADLFLKLLGDSSLRTARLNFYDLNTKMQFVLGSKDKIYVSGYFGRDVLSQRDVAGINWGNATATVRWNHIFNRKLFSNTSLIFSNYDYKISINSEATDFQIFSQIKDWNLKEEVQWYAGSSHTFVFGANFIYHTIKPGEISVTGNIGTVAQGLDNRYSFENAIYAGDTWKTNERLTIAYGARLSMFSVLARSAGEVPKTYVNGEPRLSASYQLGELTSLKVSYTRNSQNLHLISNSTSSAPTDKWVASTNIIKPETADQAAIGWFKNTANNDYEFSAEAYYKRMRNQIDYRDGARIFTNEPIENQLLFGKGRAYGLEWMGRKKAGRLTGWLSYTLSKTERNINGINNNRWYNARQDRTHDIAIVAMYQLNKKWTLSGNWIFYTGDAVTYPTGKYTLDGEVYFYYSERNGYRMPNYHRLDLGASRQLKKTKRYTTELTFSLFNAYGRANAYQVNFRENKDDPNITEAVQTSLFTFVPSISWNFKF